MNKRLKEILARKKEIRSILTSDKECNIDELEKELHSLESEQNRIEKRHKLPMKIELPFRLTIRDSCCRYSDRKEK